MDPTLEQGAWAVKDLSRAGLAVTIWERAQTGNLNGHERVAPIGARTPPTTSRDVFGTDAREATRSIPSGRPKEKFVRGSSSEELSRHAEANPFVPVAVTVWARFHIVMARPARGPESATPQLTGPSRPPAPAWSRSRRASRGAGGSTPSSSYAAPGRARAPTRPCRSAHCTSRCC